MAKAPSPSLVPRIEQALQQGRTAQALDLAKQHALQTPSAETQELLRRCYLTLVEHHVRREAFPEAHAVLSEAERLPFDTPEWWTRLAELRAELGDHTQAMKLLVKVSDPAGKAKVLGHLADRALREPGDTGKSCLPVEHHAAFTLVQQAFTEYDKKNDDRVRELLNGVGLASPFMEWKLLLRGLLAWSANEDDKARENWGRLNPSRLPAKLVAPLRFHTEPAYAASLPPTQQQQVSRQAEGLGNNLSDALRRMRKYLSTDETLPQALEIARTVVPEIKKLCPELVPRLANVFYWSIVAGGKPEDMNRYLRVFGPHPDDPQFFRLQALVMEGLNDPMGALTFWGQYEEWIAKTPERWPAAQGAYARSLLLERIGDLTANWEDVLAGEGGPDFMDVLEMLNINRAQGRKSPVAPKRRAAECFQQASELAPQRYTATLKLLAELVSANKRPEALALVDKLVADFPKNLAVLEAAASAYDKFDRFEQAQTCVRQALAINPLDRKLQTRVAHSGLEQARRFGLAKEMEAAKAALSEAKQNSDAQLLPAILALQLALEMKNGNALAANPLYDELTTLPQMRVAGPYRAMVEMTRLKCVKKTITPYANAFAEGLTTLATNDLTGLLAALDFYRQETTPYHGMKSHEKKILDSVGKVVKTLATIDEIEHFGYVLHRNKMWKHLLALAEQGTIMEPSNLVCQFFRVEALYRKPKMPRMNYRMRMQYFTVAQRLAQTNEPRYAKLRELLEQSKRESPEVDEAVNDRFGWGW